ncbi:MAG: hypothetical protein P0Y53_24445 [Candidatus Pseudobacter hemicellulosilyticus]|uniref:PIN domain-containing protein n=1 Tax=Candidatus Pseudobacter hemicellulosilyticus TaxID=3121375 RepID=A0AAJ5WSA5_9BACT|nr:MAG: hypothetical protein P0Y53_24445 [Pseudobacter sp.]
MKLVITDANIFIDLDFCGLIKVFFDLGLSIVTTWEVINEMSEPQQALYEHWVINGALVVHEFTLDKLSEAAINKANNRLSDVDQALLLLAIQLQAMVLSGDRFLRKACERLQVEVHGILWVFDQLILGNLITPGKAAEILSSLQTFNERLPSDACEERLIRWKENSGEQSA